MNPDTRAPVQPRRVVVAITGASGAIYGLRLLQRLRQQGAGVQVHAIVSAAGWQNLAHECSVAAPDLHGLVHTLHAVDAVGAAPASGSFACEAMVVAPCSMRTLAAVAHGLGDNLITRSADVMLKERRRLVLMARETPLNLAHLRNMCAVTEMGGIIFPPVPAFYQRPQTVDELVDHSVCRVLDLLGLPALDAPRWSGL